MIKLIIVDDQVIVREGLKMILSLNCEIEVVGECSNGEELLNKLKSISPDVILMDIRMPMMNGVEATKLVKELYPSIKIIILTTFNEDAYIFDVLKNGADGYILKDSGSKEIIEAIISANEGSVLLNPKVTLKVVQALNSMNSSSSIREEENEENNLYLLTARELDVTKYLLEGKSNRGIAESMFVTEGTVKNYVSRILEKLCLNNRSELILYLQRHGMQ
ncbi:MAG: response regulator transcription factor [Clostridium sp.]